MEDRRSAGIANSAPSRESAITYRAGMRLTAEQAQASERFLHQERGPFRERGPFSHLTRLAVPHSETSGGFRFNANGHLIAGLLSVQVYCDSLTGVSGNNLERDPIVADLVTSGWIEFTGGKKTHHIGPGQICIRDTKASWSFSCSPATTVRVISIPRQLVIPHIGSVKALGQACTVDAKTPEIQFLINFLEAIKRSSSELEASAAAQVMARDACATLFSRIISERTGSALDDHPRAIVIAAKNVVEKNLELDDLSPAMVARSVGVSLRTLHRSFSASDDSVMAFVRRRRLKKAHDELLERGSTTGIAEIATRWR
ncbi:helix-turn-helix domain-containing protein, partial [Streptomyces tubercidicus]